MTLVCFGLTLFKLTGGLGAASAGFLAFSSTTSTGRGFSDNLVSNILGALNLNYEELTESEFQKNSKVEH